MIDTFNIVDGGQQRQIYYANGTNSFHTWNKPSNCQFVHFFVLGGGGGGGAGQGSTTGTSRRGGAGGGSAGGVTGLFPSSFLPDLLYLQVGSGGIGGTLSSPNGTPGTLSYVMLTPDTGKTAANIVLVSGDAAGGGGASGVTGGTAGSAGTVWSYTGNLFKDFGLVSPFPGQISAAGNTTSSSNPISVSGITVAGAPGAGMNGGTAQVGGVINGIGFIPAMSGGTAGGSATSTTAGGGGSGGFMTFNPNSVGYSSQQLMFLGGAGGGSSDGGAGGSGGSGAYGCGGGGGGAGFTNLGGGGGRGGDGLIIITCW